MAEGLFRKAVAGRADYEVSSAGVAAGKGAPSNPETELLLARHGASLGDFCSRPLSAATLAAATHVFAMTRGHLELLERRFPEHSEKFYLTCEFADIPGEGIGADVPDPIGMGRKAYEEVAEVLNMAIPAIISYIDQTWKKPEA